MKQPSFFSAHEERSIQNLPRAGIMFHRNWDDLSIFLKISVVI